MGSGRTVGHSNQRSGYLLLFRLVHEKMMPPKAPVKASKASLTGIAFLDDICERIMSDKDAMTAALVALTVVGKRPLGMPAPSPSRTRQHLESILLEAWGPLSNNSFISELSFISLSRMVL